MKSFKLLIIFTIIQTASIAQNYTSYFTGDTTDVTTSTQQGCVLMGGAGEQDDAMRWFLQQTGGGDIVVLRTSGSNGYNAYLYSQLGVNVNSVQTIRCNTAAASYDGYVLQQLLGAEGLWFAGGDQGVYYTYWHNTPVDSVINYLINVKKIPVGGISAGMAIQGQHVFTALNGTITSATMLANPYHPNATLASNDFLEQPWLHGVITDSHFDSPDRRGRHFGFLAQLVQSFNTPIQGIACNEYVAVCIDHTGKARVYGDYPTYQEFAYFLQANCEDTLQPELCLPNLPLTWNRNGKAVKVYKVPGTSDGVNFFELSNWNNGLGGQWEDWYALSGNFFTAAAALPAICNVSTHATPPLSNTSLHVYYKDQQLELKGLTNSGYLTLHGGLGTIHFETILPPGTSHTIMLPMPLAAGVYVVNVTNKKSRQSTKFTVIH